MGNIRVPAKAFCCPLYNLITHVLFCQQEAHEVPVCHPVNTAISFWPQTPFLCTVVQRSRLLWRAAPWELQGTLARRPLPLTSSSAHWAPACSSRVSSVLQWKLIFPRWHISLSQTGPSLAVGDEFLGSFWVLLEPSGTTSGWGWLRHPSLTTAPGVTQWHDLPAC